VRNGVIAPLFPHERSGILLFDDFIIHAPSVIEFSLPCAAALGNSTGWFRTAEEMVTMAVHREKAKQPPTTYNNTTAARSEAPSLLAAKASFGSFSQGH